MAELCPSGGRIIAALWGPEGNLVQRMELTVIDGSSVLIAEKEQTSSGKGVQHDDRSGIFWNRILPHERI